MDGNCAAAKTRGQQRALHFPALRSVRFSSALGPLRKLVVAARDHFDCPDVFVQLDLRCLAAFDGKQHLHSDRFYRAGRSRLQKRHPHRRVREADPGSRSKRPLHRRGRSLPPPIASDPDDFLCFYFRCSSSCSQHRRGCRDAPGFGYCRLLWNARSNRLRPLSYARVLRRHHVVQRAPDESSCANTNSSHATVGGGTSQLISTVNASLITGLAGPFSDSLKKRLQSATVTRKKVLEDSGTVGIYFFSQ